MTLNPVVWVSYVFRSGSAADPLKSGDVNCDKRVDSGDLIFLVYPLFRAGSPLCGEKE
jgi:hypothetical protein